MSVMKVWNGSSWVNPFFLYPKIWNGSAWVYGIPKYWPVTASTDSKTVTVGSLDQSVINPFGPGNLYTQYYFGYSSTNGFGSLSNPVSKLYAGWDGAIITELYYIYSDLGGLLEQVSLTITGATNTGAWTTMTINGHAYLRSSASFSGETWTWNSSGLNPFGTSGTKTVTWS